MANETSSSEPRAASTKEEWNEFAYMGPGTLAGRYMRLFWHPVYVSDDLPIGRPKPIRILGEDFTLYRGESGAAHVVDFRCAHRGTQLSIGWVEGDDVRCRYHGWKYGPDGQCTEQPGEPEPFCEKVRIKSYPTQEYLGFVFAYLGEGTPPTFRRYPAFERDGVRLVTHWERGYNYFNAAENDAIHVFFTHHRTHGSWRDMQLPRIEAEETPSGLASIRIWPDGRRTQTRTLMPNMSYRKARNSNAGRGNNLSWKVPIDDHHFSQFNLEWFPFGEKAERYVQRRKEFAKDQTFVDELVAKVFSGELHLDDIPVEGADVHTINQVEDGSTQRGQGVIADRTAERLGRTDAPVILLRRIWQRELRALAEGRPLKQWELPEDDEAAD